MDNPVISIVIPVYNAERYIGRCLDSILDCQRSNDVEIICVDDGSTDSSASICASFAQRDKRIALIKQANGGPTAARQVGVKRSSGEWIMFVDADDTLPINALSDMLSVNNLENYDIIAGSVKREGNTDKIVTPAEYRSCLLLARGVRPGPWGKLIRRSLFDDFIFDIPREINHGEDVLMNLRLTLRTEKPIFLLSKIVYNYFFYPNSLGHSFRYTIEFLELYDKEMLRSLPKDDESWMLDYIVLRIKAWKRVNYMKFSTRKNRDTMFYHNLTRDIEQSGCRLSFDRRINVFGNNLPSRCYVVLFEQFPDYVVKKLKGMRVLCT